MKITIATDVNQTIQQVWKGFDLSLFKSLAPPFPPVEVKVFDGCMKGNIVSLELNFIVAKQRWTSVITSQKSTDSEIYFVDFGTELPFFLKFWEHRHRIVRRGESATIIDDITFKSPFVVLDYLLYPFLYLQFLYRKPIYRKLFA